MKHRLWEWLLAALAVLLVPLVLLSFAFALPARYDETYLAALQDKTAKLKSTEGKRIVLIGGSGAAFDVCSDLLEAELPEYRVVNLGLYAGMGTTVLLDLALPDLRTGDVVLFLPEQSEQTLSTFFDAASLWQATDGTCPPLWRLNASERGAMLGAFPTYAAGKARLYLYREKPTGDAIYARRSFNAWGDMACAGRDGNVMAGGFDTNMPITFDPDGIDADFVQAVNAFSAVCERKGVIVYFGFCPMNALAVSDAERARAGAYAKALQDRLACPILGTPEGAIWGPEWFFDTNFHLNTAGQVAYTAQLAGLLKPLTGDSSPVSITVPDPPQAQDRTVYDGDNRDAACFTYERTGEARRITGLTEQGLTKTNLTVPAAVDGLPVTEMAADTFRNAAVLSSVTIGPNVAYLPDGLFAGCTALQSIVLTNPHPETLSVGQGLLDGTDALVYVPRAAFSHYAVNYFWSMYADRLRAMD